MSATAALSAPESAPKHYSFITFDRRERRANAHEYVSGVRPFIRPDKESIDKAIRDINWLAYRGDNKPGKKFKRILDPKKRRSFVLSVLKRSTLGISKHQQSWMPTWNDLEKVMECNQDKLDASFKRQMAGLHAHTAWRVGQAYERNRLACDTFVAEHGRYPGTNELQAITGSRKHIITQVIKDRKAGVIHYTHPEKQLKMHLAMEAIKAKYAAQKAEDELADNIIIFPTQNIDPESVQEHTDVGKSEESFDD